MRTVCGSEFQTVCAENGKARLEKSVLMNGWSSSGLGELASSQLDGRRNLSMLWPGVRSQPFCSGPFLECAAVLLQAVFPLLLLFSSRISGRSSSSVTWKAGVSRWSAVRYRLRPAPLQAVCVYCANTFPIWGPVYLSEQMIPLAAAICRLRPWPVPYLPAELPCPPSLASGWRFLWSSDASLTLLLYLILYYLLCPRTLGGGIKQWCCLTSDVCCLSRTSGLNREQKGLGRPKLAQR